jgi:hypothetical protein
MYQPPGDMSTSKPHFVRKNFPKTGTTVNMFATGSSVPHTLAQGADKPKVIG